MKLNEFVCGNADAELMKSLYQTCIDSGKEPSEDLLKAMDKAGLVQVQRTVSGKHGTYTRMQWVKASDVKDSDKVVGGKNPEEEQAQVRKMKEKIKNKYAGAKTHVDRAKIDIEHVEKVRGIKFPEEERKKRLAFAEHLDKKYGDKKISPVEYGEELKEFYNASSPSPEQSKKNKDTTAGESKKTTFNPAQESFTTMDKWIEDCKENVGDDYAELLTDVASHMKTKPSEIHVCSSEDAEDIEGFNDFYSQVTKNMNNTKEFGDITVGTFSGKPIAVSPQEGGAYLIYYVK